MRNYDTQPAISGFQQKVVLLEPPDIGTFVLSRFVESNVIPIRKFKWKKKTIMNVWKVWQDQST